MGRSLLLFLPRPRQKLWGLYPRLLQHAWTWLSVSFCASFQLFVGDPSIPPFLVPSFNSVTCCLPGRSLFLGPFFRHFPSRPVLLLSVRRPPSLLLLLSIRPLSRSDSSGACQASRSIKICGFIPSNPILPWFSMTGNSCLASQRALDALRCRLPIRLG